MTVAADDLILEFGLVPFCCLVMNFPCKQHNAAQNKRNSGESVIYIQKLNLTS